MMDVETIIKNIIVKQISNDETQIELLPETNLQSIGMDSIRFIKMIVYIEKELNIEYPDDKLLIAESGTLRQITTIVENCLYNL